MLLIFPTEDQNAAEYGYLLEPVDSTIFELICLLWWPAWNGH